MGARLPSQVPPLFRDAAFYADFTRCGAQDIAEACLIGGKNPFTFSRASQATYFGPNGQIQTAANNAPRFDYNPVTLACKGLLIEEQRTNSFLNSGSPANQTVTVTNAASWTISFYGTGSIAYTGAATGTLSGTGAFPTRVSVTVTTSSTSLVLVLTGSVVNPQVELGTFATSYIPTTGASTTRVSDLTQVLGFQFTNMYNALFGAYLIEFTPNTLGVSGDNPIVGNIGDGSSNNRNEIFLNSSGGNLINYRLTVGGSAQSPVPSTLVPTLGKTYRTMLAYGIGTNLGAGYVSGDTVNTANVTSLVSPGSASQGFLIGADGYSGQILNGWVSKVAAWLRRPSNDEIAMICGITAP